MGLNRSHVLRAYYHATPDDIKKIKSDPASAVLSRDSEAIGIVGRRQNAGGCAVAGKSPMRDLAWNFLFRQDAVEAQAKLLVAGFQCEINEPIRATWGGTQ